MISYIDALQEITSDQLAGFFVDWSNPPELDAHLKVLQNSDFVVLALDDATHKVIGFITAISDGALAAYIPLLEVLPDYQGQGIGTELVQRMLEKLRDLYMVDLICDPELQPFYARFGMRPYTGMILRNYGNRSNTEQPT
jgi:ribosomal protein S18 acetylase RimI-like enzyme